MKVHGATVEEVSEVAGTRLYIGVCLATGRAAPRHVGLCYEEEDFDETGGDYGAAARAISYLTAPYGHCRARHVMEHDRKARR